MCPAEVESMFYAGEKVPWHGLGTKLDHPATAQEALVASGLDWRVSVVPIYLPTSNPPAGYAQIPNYHAVKRDSDNRIYTIVRDRYAPIQNQDAFKFFDGVVGEGQAIYHTAGSLRYGSRVWILAKLNGDLSVHGDQVEKYVCLSNSHDGTAALQMFWTPIRVVCMNTLTMAESSASNRFYTRHTTNFQTRMDLAREVLGLANKFYAKWNEQANQMAHLQLPAPQFPKLLAAAFGTTGAINANDVIDFSKIYGPVQRDMETVQMLFEGGGKGLDNPAIKGTKWAAYNAIVEQCDFYRKPKAEAPGKGSRLNSAWFGTGMKIKQRAWSYLLKS